MPETHILVVEDKEDDHFMVEDMVTSGLPDTTVTTFDTGDRAVEYFIDKGASCILLDHRLEAGDGLKLLSEFKAHDPFVPVIMLTGEGDEALALKAIKKGAYDHFVKSNLKTNELRVALESAVKQANMERKLSAQADDQTMFTKILVHDMKAPIRNMCQLGSAALEEEAAGDYAEMKKYLTMQSHVGKRALELISTLEEYALHDGDINFACACLTEVAHVAKSNLRTTISERNAKITIGALPKISGHAPQLVQLFQNLIQNAITYNQSPVPEIDIQSNEADESSVSITIVDNGIGLPDENLESIFLPFNRPWAYSQYEGIGLGLATCKKIVHRHRGKIWCTSTEGMGSQFHLLLPKSQDTD